MQTIALESLLYMLLPLLIVGYVYYRWIGDAKEVAYASARMVVQLLLIGYALSFIFANDSLWLGAFILLFMISLSSLIALRNFKEKSLKSYALLFAAIALGGSFNLAIVMVLVLDMATLYRPEVLIPLAGMIYANAMNAVALCAERFESEILINSYVSARKTSFKASMIPQINALLAVGLVSLPGMMTGQILSGVDPLIAVRYQMVVMAMVLGSAGISTILFLYWQKPKLQGK
ncbi:MAG: ABC transporter permease [Campylobacterales bacterium]|nr:ABC transporter permease [Campylobacterales bacterium]